MKLVHLSLATLLLGTVGCSAGTDDVVVTTDMDDGRATDGGAGGGGGSGQASGGGDASSGGGANGEDDVCKAYVVRAVKATPDILIVLDRSSSMDTGIGDRNRWRGSRDAVVDVTAAFDHEIRFGLMAFPGELTTPKDSCQLGTVYVDMALNVGDRVESALAPMGVYGLTPTASSLSKAHATLGSGFVGPDEQAVSKYILLVTDGEPSCTAAGAKDSDGPQPLADTLAAIQAATDDGIKTYVVGYETATTEFATDLDQMAALGNTGETTHRSVSSGADLEMTLAELAGRAVSCNFALEEAVSDPSYVQVRVDGQQLNLDDPNGWTLTDGQKVTIQGRACDQLQDGADHTLDVQVLCTVVPLI